MSLFSVFNFWIRYFINIFQNFSYSLIFFPFRKKNKVFLLCSKYLLFPQDSVKFWYFVFFFVLILSLSFSPLSFMWEFVSSFGNTHSPIHIKHKEANSKPWTCGWCLGGIKQLSFYWRKISESGYLLKNCVFAFVLVCFNLDLAMAVFGCWHI